MCKLSAVCCLKRQNCFKGPGEAGDCCCACRYRLMRLPESFLRLASATIASHSTPLASRTNQELIAHIWWAFTNISHGIKLKCISLLCTLWQQVSRQRTFLTVHLSTYARFAPKRRDSRYLVVHTWVQCFWVLAAGACWFCHQQIASLTERIFCTWFTERSFPILIES